MDLTDWPSAVAGALGGGAGMKLLDLVFGRKGREVKALSDAMEAVSHQLARTDERLERVEQHHERCQRDLATVRAEVDALMRGPVAAYRPKAPKHD